ncbi:MAG: hypothetical protein NTV45_04405 [Firmicutes bacterium]|nr:hypothetical protein [Bacillota bacterium]
MVRPLFGSHAKETDTEINMFAAEQLRKINALQSEITQAQAQLANSEACMIELQKKLEDYQSKERQISDVMIMAQINAQQIEAAARSKAAIVLQETEEELWRKNQELELLRLKTIHFKQEIKARLNEYSSSLEKILDISEEATFKPTLITPEKKPVPTTISESS